MINFILFYLLVSNRLAQTGRPTLDLLKSTSKLTALYARYIKSQIIISVMP